MCLEYWFVFVDYVREQIVVTNRSSTINRFLRDVNVDVVFTHRELLDDVFRFKSYELIYVLMSKKLEKRVPFIFKMQQNVKQRKHHI